MAVSYYVVKDKQVWLHGGKQAGWAYELTECCARRLYAYATRAAAKRCADRVAKGKAKWGTYETYRVLTRAELFEELDLIDPKPDTIDAKPAAFPRKRGDKGVPWGNAAALPLSQAPVFF